MHKLFKILLPFLIMIFNFNALAIEKIKVAVIDTGLDLNYSSQAHLCKSGHKDLTGEGFQDTHGHGTNVVGLINKYAKNDDFCIILIKAYSFSPVSKVYLTEALTYAYSLDINIINLSGGGLYPIPAEREIIMKLLKKKVTIIAAAGNNGLNLDTQCLYYPACYDSRIYTIGSNASYSNYGRYVDATYDGSPQTAFGKTLQGTSQSTAIWTGLLLNYISEQIK